MKKCLFLMLTAGILMPWLTEPAMAQNNNKEVEYTAKVIKIAEQKEIEFEGKKQIYQKIEAKIISEKDAGKIVVIENGDVPVVNPLVLKVDEKILISQKVDGEGNSFYAIEDIIRTDSLLLLFLIFMILATVISGWRGLKSILSMVITFGVIFKFILPQIASGADPILISVIGSLVIIPVIFYLSHGFEAKTTVAIGGTVIALAITGILGSLFIGMTHLFGFSSEESGFLAVSNSLVDMKGILLAGIVIGAMGVLDDVAVSQAAIVQQLKLTSERIKRRELYKRAMSVGQDHIASMINTLVLVYAGASLPLLLIFIGNPRPLGDILNYEFIAEEIVRTLVGSVGLMAAVPITTMLAVMWFGRKKISN